MIRNVLLLPMSKELVEGDYIHIVHKIKETLPIVGHKFDIINIVGTIGEHIDFHVIKCGHNDIKLEEKVCRNVKYIENCIVRGLLKNKPVVVTYDTPSEVVSKLGKDLLRKYYEYNYIGIAEYIRRINHSAEKVLIDYTTLGDSVTLYTKGTKIKVLDLPYRIKVKKGKKIKSVKDISSVLNLLSKGISVGKTYMVHEIQGFWIHYNVFDTLFNYNFTVEPVNDNGPNIKGVDTAEFMKDRAKRIAEKDNAEATLNNQETECTLDASVKHFFGNPPMTLPGDFDGDILPVKNIALTERMIIQPGDTPKEYNATLEPESGKLVNIGTGTIEDSLVISESKAKELVGCVNENTSPSINDIITTYSKYENGSQLSYFITMNNLSLDDLKAALSDKDMETLMKLEPFESNHYANNLVYALSLQIQNREKESTTSDVVTYTDEVGFTDAKVVSTVQSNEPSIEEVVEAYSADENTKALATFIKENNITVDDIKYALRKKVADSVLSLDYSKFKNSVHIILRQLASYKGEHAMPNTYTTIDMVVEVLTQDKISRQLGLYIKDNNVTIEDIRLALLAQYSHKILSLIPFKGARLCKEIQNELEEYMDETYKKN